MKKFYIICLTLVLIFAGISGCTNHSAQMPTPTVTGSLLNAEPAFNPTEKPTAKLTAEPKAKLTSESQLKSASKSTSKKTAKQIVKPTVEPLQIMSVDEIKILITCGYFDDYTYVFKLTKEGDISCKKYGIYSGDLAEVEKLDPIDTGVKRFSGELLKKAIKLANNVVSEAKTFKVKKGDGIESYDYCNMYIGKEIYEYNYPFEECYTKTNVKFIKDFTNFLTTYSPIDFEYMYC